MSGRQPDPRIVNPETHPYRWVTFTVAAEFLEMPRRALREYADEGKLSYEFKGKRPKIHIDELLRFQRWLQQRARMAS